MDDMRFMRSLLILAIIVGFPGYAAARDSGAAEFGSNENMPASPEFILVVEPDTGLFTIKNVGAPVYNATAEAHAIVNLYGDDCMTDGIAHTSPVSYTYAITADPTYPRDAPRAMSFSTQFRNDFELVKKWFEQIKDAVGPIHDHCLNSVTMRHLIEVDYDSETGIRNSRCFLAEITYRDYIDSTTHHRVFHTSEIETAYLDPDQWREKMNQVRLAEGIQFRDVSADNTDRAKKYLIEMSGAPARPSAPRNLRIISN
jgi:hypothetical protein